AWHRSPSVLMTGLYEWPMAALARIVGEDPSLQQQFTDAERVEIRGMATAALQSYEAYIGPVAGYPPEFLTRFNSDRGEYENYWISSPTGTTLQSETACGS